MNAFSVSEPPVWARRISWLAAAAGIILPLGLAWVSNRWQSLQDWPSFLAITLLCIAIFWGAWKLVRMDHKLSLPTWLVGLVLGAILLRIAFGALWFTALPVFGYGTPEEQAGYAFSDAHDRDQAAWELAQSDMPLITAITERHPDSDQYGGLLLISGFIYRYLGGREQHHPLLMVLLSACVSGLGVLLVWAFTRRAWDALPAALAAWGLALYPEAVLLGSAQMREAFTVTLTAAALYGLTGYLQEHRWKWIAWMLAPTLLYLFFSPPLTFLLIGMLALAALFAGGTLTAGRQRGMRLWMILLGLFILVGIGIWIGFKQFAPAGITDPLGQVLYWLREIPKREVTTAMESSSVIQGIFSHIPGWLQFPLLIGYGALQPFLPAALLTTSVSPLWQAVAVWRSVGWWALLPLLLYAPVRSLIEWKKSSFALALSLGVWAVILVAAYRGGGDQWDNPRYRAAFAAVQIALAAWAYVEQRRSKDPWLRRLLLGALAGMLPFAAWYLARDLGFPWPVTDVLKTLGLGLVTAGLYLLWDWARTGYNAPSKF